MFNTIRGMSLEKYILNSISSSKYIDLKRISFWRATEANHVCSLHLQVEDLEKTTHLGLITITTSYNRRLTSTNFLQHHLVVPLCLHPALLFSLPLADHYRLHRRSMSLEVQMLEQWEFLCMVVMQVPGLLPQHHWVIAHQLRQFQQRESIQTVGVAYGDCQLR